jgi:hypothetical protein
MAKKQEKPEIVDQEPVNDEIMVDSASDEDALVDSAPDEAESGEEEAAEAESGEEADAEAPGEPDIAAMTAIRPGSLHESLEAAELASLGKSPENAHVLNRITLLTGALKSALPGAIRHIEGDGLKARLQVLLDIL